jgi:hypothetical protein
MIQKLETVLMQPPETDKQLQARPVLTRAQRQHERAQSSLSAFAEIEAHRLQQAENTLRLKELRLKRDAELALLKKEPKVKKKKPAATAL